MASKTTQKHSRQAYVEGNVVRKTEPGQNRPKSSNPIKDHRKTSYQVRRNQEKALRIDLPYLLILISASCCTLFICLNYLHVRTTMTRRMDHIKALEQELDALRAENDITQTRINTAVNLDYVYQIATEELGMVYANKDQVLMYHQTESEYVRQYEDIPSY